MKLLKFQEEQELRTGNLGIAERLLSGDHLDRSSHMTLDFDNTHVGPFTGDYRSKQTIE
jgi:hypothetical protein